MSYRSLDMNVVETAGIFIVCICMMAMFILGCFLGRLACKKNYRIFMQPNSIFCHANGNEVFLTTGTFRSQVINAWPTYSDIDDR